MGRKIALSCDERLALLNQTLPDKGGITTMGPLRRLKKLIELKPKELEEFGITELEIDAPDGRTFNRLKFDKTKQSFRDKEKGFMVSDAQMGVVVAALKKLSDTKALLEFHVPLWYKFIDGQKDEEEEAIKHAAKDKDS